MQTLAGTICEELEADRPFALAVILSHRGSTPRTSGSRMLVRQDRTLAGTIGGGLVEARVMAACAGLMDKNRSAVMAFTLDQELKSGMDMVCGGSLTVWLRSFVPPFPRELKRVFTRVRGGQDLGTQGLLVTRVLGDTPGLPCLVDPADPASAALLPRALAAEVLAGKFTGPARQACGRDTYMIEPFWPRETLYIFGAGHVGWQLGQLAHLAGFTTVVLDDRAEFASPDRFPHARQVLAVTDFNRAFEGLAVDDRTYVVILTRGHLHDQEVLEQALASPAAYIGMIGSRKKRDRIYANLVEKGVPASRLSQVHCPIGTPIQAETPAEIAVSILGELIHERSRKRQGREGPKKA